MRHYRAPRPLRTLKTHRPLLGTVLLLALLLWLIHWSAGPTAATATIAVIGLAAGAATSTLLQNILAGINLRVEGHIAPGVAVTFPGGPTGTVSGTIRGVESRVSRIETAAGEVIVPNTVLAGATVLLATLPPPPTS